MVDSVPEHSTDEVSSGGHPGIVATLLVVATLIAFLAVFSIWVNRQALNTDNWVDTSGKLLRNDEIRSQLSNYLADEGENMSKKNVNGPVVVGDLWYGHADMNSGKRTETTTGALDAFFPGLLALDGDLNRARALQLVSPVEPTAKTAFPVGLHSMHCGARGRCADGLYVCGVALPLFHLGSSRRARNARTSLGASK